MRPGPPAAETAAATATGLRGGLVDADDGSLAVRRWREGPTSSALASRLMRRRGEAGCWPCETRASIWSSDSAVQLFCTLSSAYVSRVLSCDDNYVVLVNKK